MKEPKGRYYNYKITTPHKSNKLYFLSLHISPNRPSLVFSGKQIDHFIAPVNIKLDD